MLEKFETLKTQLIALGLVEMVALIIFQVFLEDYLTLLQYGLILLNMTIVFVIFVLATKTYKDRVITVTRALGRESGEAFAFARTGLITYDENLTITWMSEVFDDYNLNHIGQPLLVAFPGVAPLLEDASLSTFINLEDYVFEASTLTSKGVIVMQEKTEVGKMKQNLEDNEVVLGFAYLDNYEETTAYEEEQTIATMDITIRQAVVNWANKHNMLIRRLRADRYLLLLNEKIFKELESDRFEILNTVRNESAELDTHITLSLGFSRKSQNYRELEEIANDALELAQSRGGDQVAINTKSETTRYYGGSVDAIEKRSKVRVRVLAQNLGNLISQASNVIVIGHKMMDFDCMGSALGVSALSSIYSKDRYILYIEEDVESKLREVVLQHRDELSKNHKFVNLEQAKSLINDNTLLIMVDHHNIEQTQAPELVENVKNIVVIDHHRRTGAFTFDRKLTYIEPSASSASELIVEFFPYHKYNVQISGFEATIMYTGMLIDTNRFRNRTGSRTFEALAELRKYGADISQSENMLRDEFEDFEIKNRVMIQSEMFDDGYIITPYKDTNLKRSLMSQVADEVLKVRNVEASFVVANTQDNVVAISARSKGDLNVQRVMEKLGGGGHFTGAATQIRGYSINEVVEMLKKAILEIKEEV